MIWINIVKRNRKCKLVLTPQKVSKHTLTKLGKIGTEHRKLLEKRHFGNGAKVPMTAVPKTI